MPDQRLEGYVHELAQRIPKRGEAIARHLDAYEDGWDHSARDARSTIEGLIGELQELQRRLPETDGGRP